MVPKRTLRAFLGGLLRLPFVIVTIAIWAAALEAAPLAVNLSGGFTNQSFTIDLGNGSHDEITVSATLNLTFNPSQPACNSTEFTSSSAQIAGTIHVWGTATRYEPGSTTTKNFDNTYNYSLGPGASAPIRYEGQSGSGGVLDLDWEITTSVDPNKATPYAVHYYGGSHVLRLWVALPYPFWYPVDYEYYDSAGSTIVTGQTNVPSCLTGTVKEAASGQPVPGAQVYLGGVSRTTDSAGKFFYAGIPANNYLLVVTRAGYIPDTNVVTIPAFSIVQRQIDLQRLQLKILDANPNYLGGAFFLGARFPIDASSIWWPSALEAMAEASGTRAGAVADGATQLLLRFEAEAPGTVSFMKSFLFLGTLTGIDGGSADTPVPTISVDGKHMAFALFIAPDQMIANIYTNEITALFIPNGWDGQPIPIVASVVIKRAPVVLVHGLWSDTTVWNVLDAELAANGFETARVDYHWLLNAAGPFSYYRGVVWVEVLGLLDRQRSTGFAATRADVVAHSMGGILTRLDANDPWTKSLFGDSPSCFRRIITLDTPHFGSRAATVLLDLAGHCPVSMKGVLSRQGHPVDAGGVADLDPRTFAQSTRIPGSGVFLEATPIPSFAVCGSVSEQNALPEKDEKAIYLLAKLCIGRLSTTEQQDLLCGHTFSWNDSEFLLASTVFASPNGVPHDAIVPLESQIGNASAFYVVPGVAHTAAPANDLVIAKVISLLTTNTDPYDTDGFPAVRSSDLQLCGPGLIGAPSETETPLIRLDEAPSLLTAHPGSTIPFSVQALPGAQVDRVVVSTVQNGAIISSTEKTNFPSFFTVTAPTNILGFITVVAIAVNASNQIHYLETNVFVEPGPGTNIQSLVVNPAEFVMTTAGQISQLAVTGSFSDGSVFDITGFGSGTTYTSTVPSVVAVDSNGVVKAVAQGTATLIVSSGLLSTNVSVNVTLEEPVVLAVTPVSAYPGAEGVPFILVGSHLGGATQIEFFKDGLADSSLAVTDLAVGAAGVNVAGSLSVGSNAVPGLRTVAVTTPAGRSGITHTQGNRFFVGAPIQVGDIHILQNTTNNDRILLRLVGIPGAQCVLQASTNLTIWSQIATNRFLGGDWYFDEPMPASSPTRFYRAMLTSGP